MIDIERHTEFCKLLLETSDLACNLAGTKHAYTDENLFDCSLILMEVFMSKLYDYHKDKLTEEQLGELATEAGKSLRQTFKLFTGVDLAEVANKL